MLNVLSALHFERTDVVSLFTACLLSVLHRHVVQPTVWSPVYWNTSNPMFMSKNKGHVMQVELNDELDFVCPYVSAQDGDDNMEYYIIYEVTQQEYDSCSLLPGSKARVVISCSNPFQRKRFTILFEMFQAIPNVSEFLPGNTYYYITTSTGDKGGLLNTERGACQSHNMKLVIHICCESSGSDEEDDVISLSQTTDLQQQRQPFLAQLPTARRAVTDLSSAHEIISLMEETPDDDFVHEPIVLNWSTTVNKPIVCGLPATVVELFGAICVLLLNKSRFR